MKKEGFSAILTSLYHADSLIHDNIRFNLRFHNVRSGREIILDMIDFEKIVGRFKVVVHENRFFDAYDKESRHYKIELKQK